MSNETRTFILTTDERDRRNLNPHREARLAMIVWGSEYARQNGGSMDFYDALSAERKHLVAALLNVLEATPRATGGGQ